MEYDAIVVGGGMAGLTAGAYLSREGLKVAVLEKGEKAGGLVNSFERGGFVFDGGIRAIENSGIVVPMLRQLGIELEFLASEVSLGFGDEVIRVRSREGLEDYRRLLQRRFPGNAAEIDAILAEVSKVMDYMAVLYGIDNPLFLDIAGDPKYLVRTILPWLLKYLATMPKVAKLMLPVDEHLAAFTGNRALIDMIGQHFFKKTPAYFALSYFSLYLDYRYPKGGTGSLPEALALYIRAHGGEIRCGTEISSVDAGGRRLVDSSGAEYRYRKLVWAADTRSLYRMLDLSSLADRKAAAKVRDRAREVADKRGGDSVFTLYLALDLPPEYFSAKASPHFFYTPRLEGLSSVGPLPPGSGKEAVLAWTEAFLSRNTFEISCPVLRDPSLAPAGKTGLIVSLLMDHSLVALARDQLWYEEFKLFCSERIVELLDGSIYPGLRAAVLESFCSTPLSLARLTGNSEGAITGWAFTNDSMPAVHDLPKVARSVLTPIPDVYQAGQWSYSPSGLPISILTGKLAADAVAKSLKRRRRSGG